jgi:hypothetical protein
VSVLPAALTASLAHAPDIDRFELIGDGNDRLEVRFEPKPGVDADAAWATAQVALAAVLRAEGAPDVRIERSAARPTGRSASGKVRQVSNKPAPHPPSRVPARG